MGTTMITIKTQIPTPMMIRIRMSFHLAERSDVRNSLRGKMGEGERDVPHLLADAIGAPAEPLGGHGEVVWKR
jgi:hypothetical protein